MAQLPLKLPIRLGVVGLGRAGWKIHVEQLRGRDDCQIVAVCDPEADRRQEARAELGCRTYESIEQVIADDQVDVVVVATPSFRHGPDAIAAMEAGKHVVVEKPMATSLAEADQMLEVANRTGCLLFAHHNQRFSPIYVHLRETMRDGRIGEVFHIRRYWNVFTRRNDWQTLRRNGGGLLNNHGSHALDVILQLLEAPVTQLMGDLRQIASAGDAEDHLHVLLRAANRRTADIELSTAQTTESLPQWILCGTHGTLSSDGKESKIRWFDPAKAPPLEVIDAPVAGRTYTGTDRLDWQEQTVPSVGQDKRTFYDNLVEVLAQGGQMRVTPQSVREVIRVIAEIRRGTGFEDQATVSDSTARLATAQA